jgi:predicted Mrr-cat superfamily restriction endonuclease
LTLQVLIEVKKRVIEKAENKVDNLAVIALKQIQDAKYRYDVDNMMELKVQNLRNLPEKTSSENDLSEKTLSEHYLTIKESVKESISQNQAIESSTKFLSLSNQVFF